MGVDEGYRHPSIHQTHFSLVDVGGSSMQLHFTLIQKTYYVNSYWAFKNNYNLTKNSCNGLVGLKLA